MRNIFKKKKEKVPFKAQFRVISNGNQNIIVRPDTHKTLNPLTKEDATYYNKMYLLPHGKHQLMENFEHFVYIDPIIDGRYFWFEDEISRRAMEKNDAFYNAFIKKIADSLVKEPIQIVNPLKEGESDPKPSRNREKFWRRERLDKMLVKAIRRIRRDGYCVYYPVDKKDWPEYNTRGAYFIFSDKELEELAWDEYGHPIEWKVHIALKNGAAALLNTDPRFGRQKAFERTISIKDAVYFEPNDNQDFLPEPEGSEFWDDLIDYHYIKEAVKSFDQRLGNGFMMITVPYEMWANDTAMNKLEDKMKNVRTEKGLIIPSGSNMTNPPEFNWMGMSGVQVDFVGHLDKYEDSIAAGMRFPKRWLMGDSEGAMESSGKDKLQVHIRLTEIFNKYIDFVKAVLKFHDQIQNYDDVDIIPGFQLDLSDQEMAEMDLVKTENIVAKLDYITPNEAREMDSEDLEPIEGGDELKSVTEQNAMNEGPEGGGNDVSQGMSKSETKTDSVNIISMVSELCKQAETGRAVAKYFGVAPGTGNKILDNLQYNLKPKLKEDSLIMKQDSIQITPNIFEYDGVVLTPQVKYYEQYDTTCITSSDEIAKIFNDPTYPKEFRIGVTKSDDHSSSVKSEVLKQNAIGTVKYIKLDQTGSILGKVKIDLDKVDLVLGKENWIREYTNANKSIPLSVARRTVDVPKGSDMLETELDIRSYVATRFPRNQEIGVQ